MAREDHTVLTGGITRRGWFGAALFSAAIEVVLGILLFLFGFAEIMRYAREPDWHLDESND
jgi:hypothetical protein